MDGDRWGVGENEWAMAIAFIPMLTVASGVNVALAIVVYRAVSKTELASGFMNDEL